MQFNINFMTFSLLLLYCPQKNLRDILDEGVMANFFMTTKYLIKLKKVIGIKVKMSIYLVEEKSHDRKKKMESVNNNLCKGY